MIWPDNKRIALMVAFDIDAETMWFRRGMNMPHGIDCTKHMVAMSCGLYSTKQALPRIMKMLDDEDIKATFFTPAYIAELHPDTIKALADAGHEIAYHGYQHEVYDTYEKQDANMTKSERILEEITGKKTEYMRPPYGAWKKEMEENTGMIAVLWNVDPLDWNTDNETEIVNKVVTETEENDIILLHDCYLSSVKAALRIIDIMQAKGYEFVTVDELLLD